MIPLRCFRTVRQVEADRRSDARRRKSHSIGAILDAAGRSGYSPRGRITRPQALPMSPDPSLDPNRTGLIASVPAAGESDASDSTLVRTKQRTPGAGFAATPGVIQIPGYEIMRLLARGGMGAVYSARDLTLDREVAIKTLLPGADPNRFVTEAKITACLPHPGILPVHALGTLPDGGHYLVMKLVHGDTLAQLLKDRPSPAADLPRFVQVFEQIAQAVGFAHSRGVLHRDLKPLNVMVGAFGEVQVMDWGLAKEQTVIDAAGTGQETVPDAPELTQAGTVMGTPGYMAPEQARGEVVGVRADVFALGAMLAAVLTGQPAFVGSTARETIGKAATADLADVLARLDGCGADADLVALARRCLAPDAADRPADARAVATEVAEYRAGVEARLRLAETDRARAETQAAEQAKRRRTVQWSGGLLGAVLLAGVVGTAIGLVRADQRRVEAERAGERERERADGEVREKEEKERQRALAVKSAKEAKYAYTKTAAVLDAMVSEAAGDSLATQKVLTPEQRKFLTEVLSYYKEFAAAAGTDQETRARTARAAFRVGIIDSRLGQTDESAAAFERAIDELSRLAAEFPTVPEYRANLAGGPHQPGAATVRPGEAGGGGGGVPQGAGHPAGAGRHLPHRARVPGPSGPKPLQPGVAVRGAE